MSRLCWVFVLLVAVGTSSDDVRSHQCAQKSRSLANLELAEDALERAKQLYPYCGEDDEKSNCSECSEKDKSLGYIDVALNLITDAKENIPFCSQVPTAEPTSEVTTENRRGRPVDCQELQAAGNEKSGVYVVFPLKGKSFRVRCDMDTDGGGWTVFQRRGNFSQQENFDRGWQEYKNGFGDLDRDFWLGNEAIFALTNQGNYSLRMDMTAADGQSRYALYREFRIEDERANYKLHVGGHSGTVGKDMIISNGHMFSTKDKKNYDQYGNCAIRRKSGFWFFHHNCAECNPNGVYSPGVEDITSMFCLRFKHVVGLFSMEMKLKRL